jgi:hypothetical protein
MAVSSIASYLPTMQEFIDHWTAVNAAINPTVLTLKGGFTLATFTTDRTAIQTAITGVETVDNARQIASADRDLKKANAREKIAQYRATVLGVLRGTPYANTLPKLPPFKSNQGVFLKAMDDMANGWSRINTDTIPGFTGPLLLAGGYALAAYNTDLTAMRAAFVASTNAEDNSRQQRSVRNALLAPAKARMVQYRQAVKGILPSTSPLLATIPAVSPPPGSTPAAVNASGVWNGTTLEADLTWTASTNPNLDHYSVRTAPGPTYHAADESVVAEVPAGTTAHSTNEGLVAPGATALFRVYVVLTTANEKGSNTVSVTRPG